MATFLIAGENSNDSEAVAGLLKNNYPEHSFEPILQNQTGSLLKAKSYGKLVRIEFEIRNWEPKAIIFIVDLDGTADEKQKVRDLREKLNRIRATLNTDSKSSRRISGKRRGTQKSIDLICIYEIESLFLADPGPLNQYFNINIPPRHNIEMLPDPKFLIQKETAKGPGSLRYIEKDARRLLPLLDINRLIDKLPSFAQFIQDLEERLP